MNACPGAPSARWVRADCRARRFGALRVRTLASVPHHWFVAVVVGERLMAHVRFTLEREPMAVSFFLQHPDRLEASPLAADWLEPELMRSRAASVASADETIGEPILSFDGAPDRVAWAAPCSGD